MKKSKGFTLIEAMIVIAIVGILIALIMPFAQIQNEEEKKEINLERTW